MISLFFFIFFLVKKNIILLFKNKKIIQENKIIFTKKNIMNELENKINRFINSEISKELILKEKLFLKK